MKLISFLSFLTSTSLVVLQSYFLARLLTKSKVSLGTIIVTGLGILGVLSFWSIVLFNESRPSFISLVMIICIFMTLYFLQKNKDPLFLPIQHQKVDIILFAVILMVELQRPFGNWDAWMMWNMKAKFLASGEQWVQIFSPHFMYCHPDYPLLLPSIIAFFWKGTGTFSVYVPVLISSLFTWATCLIFSESFNRIFPKLPKSIGHFMLIAIPGFLTMGGFQYPDKPLAAYLFLAISLIYWRQDFITAFISGLTLSFLVFLKNEGILYVLIIAASFVLASWKNNKKLSWKFTGLWLLGTFLGILSFAFVKIGTPQNKIFENISTGHLDVINTGRIFQVFTGFFREFLCFPKWLLVWPVLFLVYFLRGNLLKEKDFWNIFSIAFISLALFSFFLVYVVTPYDISWHMSNSCGRLLV